MLPDYWEDPDLTDQEGADEDALAQMGMVKNMVLFGSDRSRKAFVTFLEQHLGVFD